MSKTVKQIINYLHLLITCVSSSKRSDGILDPCRKRAMAADRKCKGETPTSSCPSTIEEDKVEPLFSSELTTFLTCSGILNSTAI